VKRFIPVIAVAAALGGWLLFANDEKAATGRPAFGAPTTVVATAINPAPLRSTVEALGTAAANESVTLTSSITEIVRRINFDDGDFVEKNKVLIELLNTEEEAQLAEARANLRDLKRQLDRLRDLDNSGIAAASDVDAAQAAADAAEARLESVMARLEDRLIRAPFSGMLGFRQISQGTLLMAGDVITTIDDVETIKLNFTVPEFALALMQSGKKVYAKSVAWPDREFEGVVTAIGSRVDPITRAVSVRAVLPNDDRALRPGMLLTVMVVTDERSALSVPERSVVQIADKAYIYIVADRVARRIEVELGLRQAGNVEILAGLTGGAEVVTEGVVKLRDGSAVKYANDVDAQTRPRVGAASRASESTDNDH
jgi:membrane fusion protein (multidrug efflux system)